MTIRRLCGLSLLALATGAHAQEIASADAIVVTGQRAAQARAIDINRDAIHHRGGRRRRDRAAAGSQRRRGGRAAAGRGRALRSGRGTLHLDSRRAVGAQLAFHPSLRLRPIVTNSPAIWSAISADETPPPVAPAGDGAWLRVWQALSPTFRPIDEAEAAALAAAAGGETFGAICAALDTAEAAAEAGAMLAAWIADGLFVAVS